MRAYSVLFNEKNSDLIKDPRYVVVLSFDIANTDLYYFTSHDDCEVPPGTDPSKVIYSVLRKPIVNSQSLDPRTVKFSIGTLTFELLDVDNVITNLLNSKLTTPELITNGTFDTDTDWTKGTGWTISGGKANNSGSTGALQSLAYVGAIAGEEYIVSLTITSYTSGTLRFSNGTGITAGSNPDYTAPGTYSINVTPSIDGFIEIYSVLFNGSIDNVSVQRVAGDGVRHKRVQAYKGYQGLPWADYQLPPGGTQIVDGDLVYNEGVYTFQCKDAQRIMQTTIFDVKKTNLTSAYTAGDTVVNVADTTDFEMVAHGASFSDAPSSTVGYFKIDDNVIRYTGKTSTTFTGCVGGRFSTKDVNVDVDSGAANDQKPTVEEFIYLEMPAAKMAKCVLMGTNPTVPDHWHMGVSSAFVSTTQFNTIGDDLYDPTDDTKGFILRFDGLKKREGKKFLQEQINLPQGCFMPVLSDGQLGYKRMAGIVSGASTVATLDMSNVISFSPLKHRQTEVYNQYAINWNKLVTKDKPTRRNVFIDSTSIVTHQTNVPYELSFEGLHGSRHTDAFIRGTFDALRDRYSGPPQYITVDVFQSLNGLEIGDIVWCNFNQRDFVGGGDIQRAFEVIGYKDDGNKITLNLFGSSQKAGALSASTLTTVLGATFYTAGLVAGNKLDSALTTTLTGGVLHITANGTLTGGADATDVNNIFWYDGAVEIDSGVDVTWTDNIQIRCHSLNKNGRLLSIGGGHSGAIGGTGDFVDGTAGKMGATESGGGTNHWERSGGGYRGVSRRGGSVVGDWLVLPVPLLVNNSTSIDGLPTDLRGCSGSSGGSNFDQKDQETSYGYGGNGGDGGGGIIIVTRSITAGASGAIDVSGGAGSLGESHTHTSRRYYAGSGAGGAPGGCLILIDGTGTASPIVIADQGETPIPPGTRIAQGYTARLPTGGIHSYYEGSPNVSHVNAHHLLYRIPPSETAAEDVADLTLPPTAINIAEASAAKNTMNIVYLEISVTAPSATNYRGSMIYIKKNGTNAWQQVGEATGADEVVIPVAADGTQYNVKAHPVSIKGVESAEFYGPVNHTVGTTQVAVIGTNNALATDADIATNGGVQIDTDGFSAFDNGGDQTFEVNANTGRVTSGDTINEKYIDFNPSTGVFEFGRDVQLRGADAYNNDNIYLHDIPLSVDGYITSQDATGISGTTIASGQVRLKVNGVVSNYAKLRRVVNIPIVVPTFSKNRNFRISVIFNNAANYTGYIVSGYIGFSYFGFKFTGGNLYGCHDNGTSEQLTAALITGISSSISYKLEAIFTAGGNVKFYINDLLIATSNTTNLPSGPGGGSDNFLWLEGLCDSATASDLTLDFSEYKILQEF